MAPSRLRRFKLSLWLAARSSAPIPLLVAALVGLQMEVPSLPPEDEAMSEPLTILERVVARLSHDTLPGEWPTLIKHLLSDLAAAEEEPPCSQP